MHTFDCSRLESAECTAIRQLPRTFAAYLYGMLCRRNGWFAVIAVIALLSRRVVNAEPIVVVRPLMPVSIPQKRSLHSILIAKDAPATVRTASAELQRVIRESTGVTLPIGSEPGPRVIALGQTPTADGAGITAANLADDSFRIVTVGESIFIVGKDTSRDEGFAGWQSAGTLFGTYAFLERFLNVRWLLPGDVGEEIPHARQLVVPVCDIVETPGFQVRELIDVQNQIRPPNPIDLGPAEVTQWLLRQRMANPSVAFLSTREKVPRTHAWDWYITKADLDRNPDFRAQGGSAGKFCTSNRRAVELFGDRVCAWLKDNPRAFAAPISPEDGANFCRCPSCLARTGTDWHGKESYTPVILAFYNDVARTVAARCPGRNVAGYVYSNYTYPPADPGPVAPNLFLWIAPLNYYGWGLVKPPYAAEFDRLVGSWRKVTPNLCYINWSQYLRAYHGTPIPPCDAILSLEIPTLHRHRVFGVTMVGLGAWGYGGCTNYLLARQLWDPNIDVAATRREWVSLAYGPAAPTMEEFYATIEKRIVARKLKEPVAYSGDQYEINKSVIEEVYRPIFPSLERMYMDAVSKVATPKQRARLQMLGDNLVMLHYSMRRAGLLPKGEPSEFRRTNEEYASFLAEKEFSLALYRNHGRRDLPPIYDGQHDDRAENPPMEQRRLIITKQRNLALAPVVDGRLDEPVWRQAPIADTLRTIGDTKAAPLRTSCGVVFDDEALYLGVVCEVPVADTMPATETRRDGDVSKDESIELLIDVGEDVRDIRRFQLTGANVQCDVRQDDRRADFEWSSAVGRMKRAWVAEIRIPWQSLDLQAPPADRRLPVNVSRVCIDGDHVRRSTWNASYHGAMEPASFGEWEFQGEP
jgi:hypothetical protein